MKKTFYVLLIFVITGFGLLTLALSSSIFLDLFNIRAQEGNYVLFVVWANFICSILYLLAAYGLSKNRKWSISLLGISTLILIAALIGLFIYIDAGGLYETKTIGALSFRISLSFVFTGLAYLKIKQYLQFKN